MLDLEREVMRGTGSIATVGVTFFNGLFCFHEVKPFMPVWALLPTLCGYENSRVGMFFFLDGREQLYEKRSAFQDSLPRPFGIEEEGPVIWTLKLQFVA